MVKNLPVFNPRSGNIPHASGQLSLCTTTIKPVLQGPGAATTEPMPLEPASSNVQIERLSVLVPGIL